MNFELVTEHSRLVTICQKARKSEVIMLDTEFVRTRTLYPKLGLIQLYDGNDLALIDPVSLNDLSPLWDVLTDKSVLKVLHACSEDLEVFQHYSGVMPTPMIDTQIMAAFVGHGLSTGFAALVKEYLGVELDKGEARTDWCARPLTDKQMTYAAADVFYLYPLYEKLSAPIAELDCYDALTQECELVRSKRGKEIDLDTAYLDINNAWQLRPKQLAVLKKLAAWRITEARRRDLALNFIVKDLHLWKMARFDIRTLDKMAKEGFDHFEIERHGSRLIRMLKDVDKLPTDQYPDAIIRLVDLPDYKQAVKSIKEITNNLASKLGVVSEFVASKKQIHQLLKWVWVLECQGEKIPDLLVGWRKQYLENELIALLKINR